MTLEDLVPHSRDNLGTGSVLQVEPDLHGRGSHPDARPWSHTPFESWLEEWSLVELRKRGIFCLKLLLNALY